MSSGEVNSSRWQDAQLEPTQCIDLLQLSRYELIQKIDREIEINPFVEKEIFQENKSLQKDLRFTGGNIVFQEQLYHVIEKLFLISNGIS